MIEKTMLLLAAAAAACLSSCSKEETPAERTFTVKVNCAHHMDNDWGAALYRDKGSDPDWADDLHFPDEYALFDTKRNRMELVKKGMHIDRDGGVGFHRVPEGRYFLLAFHWCPSQIIGHRWPIYIDSEWHWTWKKITVDGSIEGTCITVTLDPDKKDGWQSWSSR